MNPRVWLLVLLCSVLVGCPTPTQYGGPIHVDQEGFDARMHVMCGMGRGPGQGCEDPIATSSMREPDAGMKPAASRD